MDDGGGKIARPAPVDADATPVVPQRHMEPLDVLATVADARNVAEQIAYSVAEYKVGSHERRRHTDNLPLPVGQACQLELLRGHIVALEVILGVIATLMAAIFLKGCI